jgi:hypothetical protein
VLQLNSVKSYVYVRVRLLFDPPATSYAIEALNKTAQEYEWRLNVFIEGVKYPLAKSTTAKKPKIS